jgi:hypothetical protein
MDNPEQPLDPEITLSTLLRESDYRGYGYELPGNAPQVMGALVANYFYLDPHAIALCCISLLEYLTPGDQSHKWFGGPSDRTKLDPE